MFIIVWSGLGFLAALIPVALTLIGNAALDAIFGPGWSAAHEAATAIWLFISAGMVWIVGARLNGKPGSVLTDKKTGQKVTFKQRHSLFWIPMQWFSPAIAAIGLALLLK